MLIFVIIFNFLLTLLNLYVAFRLWKLRQVLARVSGILNRVERRIDRIFYPAPEVILIGQEGTYHLRVRYQILISQLERLQQILMLVTLGIGIWQRQRKKRYKTSKIKFWNNLVKTRI